MDGLNAFCEKGNNVIVYMAILIWIEKWFLERFCKSVVKGDESYDNNVP
jgi:hypothetical protein